MSVVSLPIESKLRARQILLNSPRELSGFVLSSFEKTLATFEGENSAPIVDNWYRTAMAATYGSVEAAAAYMGAYGPRSILKIQEAVFALLLQKDAIDETVSVIDYGAGPGLGFAAFVDLFSVLTETSGFAFALRYIAVDRSQSMRQVGSDFCARIKRNAKISTYFEFLDTNDEIAGADLLILSNVLNEGEGCEKIKPALQSILNRVNAVKDVVIIEPAGESTARQMCSLGDELSSFHHIGPCPSSNSVCNEWSFRQFTKRVYSFEVRCLGQWAPAARTAKYALALLSCETPTRSLSPQTSVVVGQPLSSNRVQTCRFGVKSRVQVVPGAAPWDAVTPNGDVENWWP